MARRSPELEGAVPWVGDGPMESFADRFGRAFAFPAGSGPGREDLAGVPPERLGRQPAERIAIVSRRADHSASFNLKCVVEAGAFILRWARKLERSHALPTCEVVLFLCGQMRDFAQPPPGWTPASR